MTKYNKEKANNSKYSDGEHHHKKNKPMEKISRNNVKTTLKKEYL